MNGVETLPAWFWPVVSAVVIWSSIWKALALWKAAKKGHVAWFIVMFLINLVGILEILYIFVFSKCCEKKRKKQPEKQARKRRKR